MYSSDDYRARARSDARERFRINFPFFFLIGTEGLHLAPQPKHGSPPVFLDAAETHRVKSVTPPIPPELHRTVLAVRKASGDQTGLVSLGRTAKNDLVLDYEQVSKTHAFFKVAPGSAELFDNASRNGTWVNDRRLPPRSEYAPLHSGDRLGFGNLALLFVDAGACWDLLQLAP